MFELQENIFHLLCDLKENCHAVAVKSEFESEGASYDEILYLKKLISPLPLELTVKIGGCEAIRDMTSFPLNTKSPLGIKDSPSRSTVQTRILQ